MRWSLLALEIEPLPLSGVFFQRWLGLGPAMYVAVRLPPTANTYGSGGWRCIGTMQSSGSEGRMNASWRWWKVSENSVRAKMQAEAMTIFAVICAPVFPVIHIGRPW